MQSLRTQPDEWVESAPETITVTREVAAGPARIWEVLADHESWPEWFDALKDVAVTGPASGVGARRRVRVPGMDIDEEFVAWDERDRFAFTVVAMTRAVFESMNERVTIEELGADRSRVVYTQAFAPKWWFGPFFGLLKSRMRGGLAEGMEGLARRVESG